MKMKRAKKEVIEELAMYRVPGKTFPIHELFYEIIRDLSLLTDLQRGDVAEASGVGKSTLYFWMCGPTFNPRLNGVIKVAYALGYDLKAIPRKDGKRGIKVRKPKLTAV